jgi:hypothetical protein
MSQGPQYTSCVEPADFEPLNTALIATLAALIVGGGIAAFFSAGIGAIVAIASFVQLMRYLLDFMLNGKLICLHRDPAAPCQCSIPGGNVCAIGEMADTEDVGEDKNPIEDIDNDYGINLVLAPFDMKEFALHEADENLQLATKPTQPQGDLLRMQPGMPEEDGNPKFTGYFRTMVMTLLDGKYHAWTEIVGRDYGWFGIVGPDQQKAWGDYLVENAWLEPKKFSVPVLHCEFEGSRINDMLAAIEAFSFGGKWCKKNWFFRLLCIVLQTIFAPFALAAMAIAWAAASDGNPADALQGGGTLSNKDWVIVRGRWAYDGGHTGWNEIHATRIVQKVFNVPNNPTEFPKFLAQWCERMSEVPRIDSPGLRPQTSEEQATYDSQQQPENQWKLHPFVDGCKPKGSDSTEPPIIK